MAYEDYQPQVGALGQASTDPNAQIQQLLQKEYLRRVQALGDPQQDARRQSALESVQSALRGNPAGTYTPTEHSLATTVGAIGRMNPTAGISLGAQAGSDMSRQLEAAKFKNRVAAENLGYEDIKSADKNDIGELAALGRAMYAPKSSLNKSTMGSLVQTALDAQRQAAKLYDPSRFPNMQPEDVSKLQAQKAKELFTQQINMRRAAGEPLPEVNFEDAVGMADNFNQPKPQPAPTQTMGQGGKQEEITLNLGNAPKEIQDRVSRQFAASLQIMNNPNMPEESRAAARKTIQDLQAKYPLPAEGVRFAKEEPARHEPTKTALSAGYTAEGATRFKESPFAAGLDLPEVFNPKVPNVGYKAAEERTKAFYQSPEYKELNTEVEGAQQSKRVAEKALANLANTNELSDIANSLTRVASAIGIPMSESEKKQMQEYVRLNQGSNLMVLAEQIMQKGPQTESDATRMARATFDTKKTPAERRAMIMDYLDTKVNPTLNRKAFVDDYLSHPNIMGNIDQVSRRYEQFHNTGDQKTSMPQSVAIPGGKVVPYYEAAQDYWASARGKANKPSKNDTPEEAQAKRAATAQDLNRMNAAVRAKMIEVK